MSSGVYGRGPRLGAGWVMASGEGVGTGKVSKGSREVKLFEITPPPPNKKHRDRDKIRQIAVIAMV